MVLPASSIVCPISSRGGWSVELLKGPQGVIGGGTHWEDYQWLLLKNPEKYHALRWLGGQHFLGQGKESIQEEALATWKRLGFQEC